MISSFRNLCNTYICNSIKKKPNDFSYGNILQFMLNISLLKYVFVRYMKHHHPFCAYPTNIIKKSKNISKVL